MILVNVLLGFSQFFRAIPIMNPLPWFMIYNYIAVCIQVTLAEYQQHLREHNYSHVHHKNYYSSLILPACRVIYHTLTT